MESESSFYLTLPSNTTTTFVNNKPQSYRVQLAKPISLEGKWEVALTEIQYPHNWTNITEESIFKIYVPREDEKGSGKEMDRRNMLMSKLNLKILLPMIDFSSDSRLGIMQMRKTSSRRS